MKHKMITKYRAFALFTIFILAHGSKAQQHLPVPQKKRIMEIAKMLPKEPKGIGQPISDRDFWDALSNTEQAGRVIEKAILLLDAEPLPVNKEQWMAYIEGKTERQNYEQPFWEQQRRFCTLVLAEALENKGRFIQAIENLLRDMLSLGTWKKPQSAGMVDVDYWYGRKHFVELAIAQRSFTTATADYWLQDKLDPEIRRELRDYIRRDALDPYLKMLNTPEEEWFWMMGDGNWNAVCHAGVVGAALSILKDVKYKATIVAGAELGKEYYLEGFGEEGYCNEGIGYWRYGFGHFMVLSEIVRLNTQNAMDWLNDPRAIKVSAYPSRVEILNGIYPSFSDVRGVYYNPQAWMIDFAEERMGILNNNAISFWTAAQLDDINDLYFHGLFQIDDYPDYNIDPDFLNAGNHSDIRDFFSSGGLLILRPFKRDPHGMAVSIKGGNNSEHHNHNDLGTFEIVLGSEKLAIDPGAQLYGRNSSASSGGRYESELMNSFGHPVPVVAGQLQATGRNARAEIIEKNYTLLEDYLKFDLSSAYEVETLRTLTRSYVYKRGKYSELVVKDEVEFSQPENFENALIIDTYNQAIVNQPSGEWQLTGDNQWIIQKGNKAIQVTVTSPGNEIIMKAAPVKAHLGRMPEGYNPIRLGFALKEKVKSAEIIMKITPVER